MKRAILVLPAVALALWVTSPAWAQSSSTDSDQNSNAGGSSASGGSNSSSLSVHTGGGSSVGVAQGSVSGGSRASGSNSSGNGVDQSGAANSGAGSSGQSAGVAVPAANAVEEGVVSQVSVPALDLGPTKTAADTRPDVLTWAIAAVIVIGLVVLYRRLPRSTPAA